MAGKNSGDDLRAKLVEHGCKGHKLGIEFDASGLTAYNWRRIKRNIYGQAGNNMDKKLRRAINTIINRFGP